MKAIELIARQFTMNTRWFKNVLDGINDQESLTRINGYVNHLRWIAGHLTTSRYRNMMRIGLPAEEFPYLDVYMQSGSAPAYRPVDESISYPRLPDLLHYWDIYSTSLSDAILLIPDEKLNSELPFTTPIGGKTVLESLGFVVGHEAYHIGQMSLIRKSLGHSSMVYM